MIAKVYSAIPCGYDGQIVEVEGDINNGLPSFNIVGMANKTVSEARERVRSAITNSNLAFPTKKVTINLAPAELSKDGTHLDLPIALAILILAKQLLPSDLENRLFAGELSLDGTTKPVRGIINIIETAKCKGFSEVYIPKANLEQALLVPNIKIIGVSNLLEILLHLKGVKPLSPSLFKPVYVKNTDTDSPLLDDIRGQTFAKRAMTIAIAGHHNILLSGPPGAGKTLLAHAAESLLPPLSTDEQIAATKIYSLHNGSNQIVHHRPFRSPHHTASAASIIGGSNRATPGEISLAHHGVLFLDEMPEYPRNVLEALRQPLEDRKITISRTHTHTTYPADFMLIATMNPCPCGHLGDPTTACTCTPYQIQNYRKRLSGPILDRIDLIVNVERVANAELSLDTTSIKYTSDIKSTHPNHSNDKNISLDNHTENSKTSHPAHSLALQQINTALTVQKERFHKSNFYNSNLTPQDISVYVKITETGHSLLQQAVSSLNLSARSYFKIIKVAQTIADLSSKTEVDAEHISEALSLRQQIP